MGGSRNDERRAQGDKVKRDMKSGTIKKRLQDLEKVTQSTEKPIIVIMQCLDDPGLYFISGKPGNLLPEIDAPDYQTYANGKPGDRYPKQELIDKLEKDYLVIVVNYAKRPNERDE